MALNLVYKAGYRCALGAIFFEPGVGSGRRSMFFLSGEPLCRNGPRVFELMLALAPADGTSSAAGAHHLPLTIVPGSLVLNLGANLQTLCADQGLQRHEDVLDATVGGDEAEAFISHAALDRALRHSETNECQSS